MVELQDVIVVGAGPAGSRAARLLAEARFRVLLLEKEKLPRYKACAGGLTGKAQTECGLSLDGLVERWVYGSRCQLDENHPIVVARNEEPSVAMVMRDRFDAALTEAAQNAGARLMEEVKVRDIEEESAAVRVKTSKGSYRSRFLLGADGAASIVSQCLKLKVKTQYNPAVQAELCPPKGKLEPPFESLAFYDMGAIPGGYGWVFPKLAHYSTGLCSTYAHIRKIMPLFRAFLASHSFLEGCTPKTIRGWLIPCGTTGGSIVTRRCALAGDAAGCADPLTGEGIAYALISGRLAASSITDALLSEGTPGLSSYQKAMDKEIYSNLRLGKWFAKIYYALPRLSFRILLRDKRVVRRYFELMAGRADYKEIIRLMLKNWWRLRIR